MSELSDRAYIQRLEDALKKYGLHLYHECTYRFVYDRLSPERVSGHWEHRGTIAECMCGLAQILAKILGHELAGLSGSGTDKPDGDRAPR